MEVPRDRFDDRGVTREAGGRIAREIGIKELKDRASEVIERVANGERVAVTRRNELAAVILSIEEALEFVLAHAEDFVRARTLAREEQHAGKSVSEPELDHGA
jgi:prevent-host-death family protein